MNRLIIIGNGFDLAHGLKTSYKDFIANYLYLVINSIYLNRPFEDELINLIVKKGNYYQPLPNDRIKIHESIQAFIQILEGDTMFKLDFNSILLKNTFEQIENLNWVDFEIEYFNEVKNILNRKENPNYSLLNDLINLNKQFDVLKNKLIEYLLEQESKYSNPFQLQRYGDLFTEPIEEKEISLETVKTHNPNNILFLNFNYTNTVEGYIQYCRDKKINTQINYIHGKLNDSENPIIFGFGDEYDQKYIELEHMNNNKLFEHIKSFGYLRTDNYANLTRFVSAEKFQVHIYGHSCGLSDRTMFKEIFEHENCISIKIFYHQRPDGSNDFTDKCYDIYRHFTNKNMMRNKVVNEQYCMPMPQL